MGCTVRSSWDDLFELLTTALLTTPSFSYHAPLLTTPFSPLPSHHPFSYHAPSTLQYPPTVSRTRTHPRPRIGCSSQILPSWTIRGPNSSLCSASSYRLWHPGHSGVEPAWSLAHLPIPRQAAKPNPPPSPTLVRKRLLPPTPLPFQSRTHARAGWYLLYVPPPVSLPGLGASSAVLEGDAKAGWDGEGWGRGKEGRRRGWGWVAGLGWAAGLECVVWWWGVRLSVVWGWEGWGWGWGWVVEMTLPVVVLCGGWMAGWDHLPLQTVGTVHIPPPPPPPPPCSRIGHAHTMGCTE